MNLQQLEYIVAVDRLKHFGRAAESCFVTQPTLSAMINKLELELDVIIFDRSSYPVATTECGKDIIEEARRVLYQVEMLKDKAAVAKNQFRGELKIGVIPTVAPYLLPLVLFDFTEKYPEIRLTVKELQTENLLQLLRNEELDAGIAATPLHEKDLSERRLYLEELKVFVSSKENKITRKYLHPTELDHKRIWMLEEGHCLRDQLINLCHLEKNELHPGNLNFQAGSLDTVMNMVEVKQGITLLPELLVHNLDSKRVKQVRSFTDPVPVREISLLTYRPKAKYRLLEILIKEIKARVNPLLAIKHEVKEEDVKIIQIH